MVEILYYGYMEYVKDSIPRRRDGEQRKGVSQ